MVFFHELGHFLVARWYGVRVLVFSIGFGPELFGFNDRYGTRWKVSAIPLGGYVKFFGDENAASVPDQAAIAAMSEEERRQSFIHQKVGPRAAIVVAGPLANFLLAIVIFAGLFMVYGKQSTTPRVDSIQPESAAAAAGFQPGDLVLSINGRPIESFAEMQRIVSTSAGETLTIVVDRAGVQLTLKAVPALQGGQGQFRQRAPNRSARHQPVAGARRREVRAGQPGQGGRTRRGGNLVRDRTHAVLYRRRVRRAARRRTSSADQSMIAQVSGQVANVGFAACCILPRCCRYRSDCSICSRFRCSMAVTFCST